MIKYKKWLCLLLLLFIFSYKGRAQDEVFDTSFKKAYDTLFAMLSNEGVASFKRAVFISENAFFNDKLAYGDFQNEIYQLIHLAKGWSRNNPLTSYKYRDSTEVKNTLALFTLIKDTIEIKNTGQTPYRKLPYVYNFNDYFGRKDWANTFVTRLLNTGRGNCHSMPYLYKILADELSIKNAWLSFAPYHIYVKNHCEGIGWYNTELTSGQFPIDSWIMASGYVPVDAIRSGIYMDTLSNEQAVANCVLDLAKGYERKYKIYTDSFIVRCCDLTLKYHPNNINAIIYKAEVLKKIYLIYKKENQILAAKIYPDMEKLYIEAMDLGYKEMPEKMYLQWLGSVTGQPGKYSDKKIKEIINAKTKR